MTTTTDIARRNGGAPAQPSAALAIRNGQTMWDDKQRAALVAMGVSEKATNAELAVFFHQCRNTQLDPFLKQIYLIHRRAKEGDRWVDKPTTQIGIDGFRVIRDRIADKKGLRVEYEDTIWFDADGGRYDVWLWDEPPAACRVVVLVDGRRFPSVLRFNEYCQRNKDGDRTGKWRDAHAHQIEKCTEADALRKAFPNDMSGLILEDAAPLDDPDAPARLPQDRQQVTAEQIRQRPRPVQSRVVDTEAGEVTHPENASPAAGGPPSAAGTATPPAGPAGEVPDERPPALATTGQMSKIRQRFTDLGYSDSPEDEETVSRIMTRLTGGALNGRPTQEQATAILDELKPLRTAADLEDLLRDLASQEAASDG
jgi:phage recombination protein Bet